MIMRYVLLFFVASLTAGLLIYQIYLDKMRSQMEVEQEVIHLAYTSAIETHRKISKLFFANQIDTDEIKAIVAEAFTANDARQVELRAQLFSQLERSYRENKKLYHLKQLHFHFPNNHSFLRFHRPNKFGDDLTQIRATIKFVNQQKQAVNSFEEGRIYNGYRYVFPLFYRGEHIGSVETSISMQEVISIINQQTNSNSLFLLKKSLVDQKVFASERNNYIETSLHGDYVIEKPLDKQEARFIQMLNSALDEIGSTRLGSMTFAASYREYGQHNGTVYTNLFYPIINEVSGEQAGYIVVHRHHDDLQVAIEVLYGIFFTVLALIALGLFFHWRYQQAQHNYIVSVDALHEVQKAANIGSWKYSMIKGVLTWNKQAYRIFDTSEAVDVSKDMYLSKVHPDDRLMVKAAWEEAIEKGREFKIEYRIIHSDHSVHYVEDTCHFVKSKHNKNKEIVGLVKDITVLKEAVLRFSTIVDSQNNMVLIMSQNNIEFFNKTMISFLEINGIEHFKLKYGCILKLFNKKEGCFYSKERISHHNWIDAILKRPEFSRKVCITDKNRIDRVFLLNILPYEYNKYIISFSDITYLQIENTLLQREVNHDKLTGAFNRRFLETVFSSLTQSVTQNKNLFVAILDIDFFKQINDQYGHLVGDDVLIELVRMIKQHIRHHDKLVRWGGEEFVFMFEAHTAEDAVYITEKLREQIADHPFPTVGHVTCSFGLAHYNHDDSLTDLLERADKALYQSKEQGRNCVNAVLNSHFLG